MKLLRPPSIPYIELSFFTSIIAIVIAIFFCEARSSLARELSGHALTAAGFSLFILNAPLILIGCFNRSPSRWYSSQSFFTLLAFAAVLACVRFVPGDALPFVRVILPFVGSGCFLVVAAWYINNMFAERSFIRAAIFTLCFMCFSLWVMASVWTSYKHVGTFGSFYLSYFSPLFLESLCLGEVHLDTLFHSSITSMIQTYGIPSTGLNGLPFLRYHTGSHWLFSQLSILLGIDVVNFYQLCYPVIFLPLYFYAMFLFMLRIKDTLSFRFNEPNRLFTLGSFFIFLAAFISFLPSEFSRHIGLGAWFISPSYILSLSLVFLMICLYLSWVGDFMNRTALRKSDSMFLFAVLPVLIVCVGFLKVSSMILICIAITYMVMRCTAFKRISLNFALLLSLCLALITFYYTTPQYGKALSFEFLHYLRNYVASGYRVYYLLFHYIWVVALVGAIVVTQKWFASPTANPAIRSRQLLVCEVVLVISVAGFLPGAFMEIPGGSAAYFSGLQQWIALPILLAFLGTITIKNRAVMALCIFISIPFLFIVASNFNTALTNYREGLARQSATIAKADPRQFDILDVLQELDAMPINEKQKTLLFIPQNNEEYWGLSAQLGCATVPFIAPALSGIAMLDGLPPMSCDENGNVLLENNGYACYALRNRDQSDDERADTAVCEKALQKGFQRIISIDCDGTDFEMHTLDCR